MHIFELTRRLMEIESISGNEAAAGYFLRDYLSGLKYDVSLQEAAPNRFNVIAFAGKPELVFSTHIDTVPPYLPVDEDEEYLYGRGACDAKGIVAAQIEAAENLRASGASRVGLLFVVGEERDSVGALAASKIPPGSRFLINGEPTDNHLALGSKGSLRVEISARGKAAHSAYPQMGESAILKLLDLLDEIRAMALPHDPILGESTCNIGVLEGGTKANIIPDSARAELMFRSVEPIELLKERLEILIAGRADSRYLFEVPPFIMQAIEGFDTTVVSFASDAPFLTEWGKPFLLGPGSILNAHTDHERISKQELLEGVELYVSLARTLLS
jgi:acetylornithine deacetylase